MDVELQWTAERVVEGKTPEAVWRRHLIRYQFAARRAAGKQVLDVACGTGYGSRILLDAGARRVLGVDICPEAIAYARDRYGAPGLDFRVGDAADLSPYGQFDLIVSFETIEHTDDGAACVAQAARALKGDGEYLLSTPNMVPFLDGVRRFQRSPFHQTEYDATTLGDLLQRHFGRVELYGQMWYPCTWPGKVLWWFRRKTKRWPLKIRPLRQPSRWAVPGSLVAVCREPTRRQPVS